MIMYTDQYVHRFQNKNSTLYISSLGPQASTPAYRQNTIARSQDDWRVKILPERILIPNMILHSKSASSEPQVPKPKVTLCDPSAISAPVTQCKSMGGGGWLKIPV